MALPHLRLRQPWEDAGLAGVLYLSLEVARLRSTILYPSDFSLPLTSQSLIILIPCCDTNSLYNTPPV